MQAAWQAGRQAGRLLGCGAAHGHRVESSPPRLAAPRSAPPPFDGTPARLGRVSKRYGAVRSRPMSQRASLASLGRSAAAAGARQSRTLVGGCAKLCSAASVSLCLVFSPSAQRSLAQPSGAQPSPVPYLRHSHWYSVYSLGCVVGDALRCLLVCARATDDGGCCRPYTSQSIHRRTLCTHDGVLAPIGDSSSCSHYSEPPPSTNKRDGRRRGCDGRNRLARRAPHHGHHHRPPRASTLPTSHHALASFVTLSGQKQGKELLWRRQAGLRQATYRRAARGLFPSLLPP